YDSLLFFFLHVPAPPVISPLSLHDALPICFSSFFSDRQLSTDLHIQMHRKPILITLICCALAVLANGCGKPDADASASASSLTIIPAPREVVPAPGQFAVTDATRVIFEGATAEPVARYFVDLLQRTGGPALQTEAASSAPEGGIRFQLAAGESAMPEEAYTLAISSGGVAVRATDARGLFYG